MKTFFKGSKVCFIGDSITAANGFVTEIVRYYHDNLPELKVNFFNCGVSGGTLQTQLNNFNEDVKPYKPDYAVIMLGTNDSMHTILNRPRSLERYQKLQNAFEDFKSRYEKYCDMLEELGTTIILCSPVPFAEYIDCGTKTINGAFSVMIIYSQFVKEFAKRRNYDFVDYNSYMTKVLQYETDLYDPDRTHPTNHGHFYMAKCFLEYQGLDIGEEKPYPEYLSVWRENVAKLRNVYTAEWLILKDYPDKSTEEKIKIAQAYIDEKKYIERNEKAEIFKKLAQGYIKNKPFRDEYRKNADKIMQIDLKK